MRVPFSLVLLTATLAAQTQPVALKPFRESPAASVTQELGCSTVKIDYHRPAVKGRKVWGGLVPYGEVWRTGANEATTLTFSDPVTVGGQTLPAGTYALFTIPGPQEWTFILNRTARQWGAYQYKAEADAVRIQARPRATPFQESLGFALQVAAPDRIRVEMTWEKLAVGFDLGLDAQGIYWAYLEKSLAGAAPGDASAFLQGAAHCLSTGQHLEKGLEWVDRALGTREDVRGLETKARILDRLGRRAEALPLLSRALDLAVAAKASREVLDRLGATRAEWTR